MLILLACPLLALAALGVAPSSPLPQNPQSSATACTQCANWSAPVELVCYTRKFCQPKDACEECSKAWCETRLVRKLDCGGPADSKGTTPPTPPPTTPLATPPGAPRPGQARGNPKDGLTYVWIPPGSLQMGCSPGDNECNWAREKPKPVTISRGFWLGQTEVTVGAWKRYRAETGTPALPTRDSVGRTNLNEAAEDDRVPAVMMTWAEAGRYCAWAGGRLPTEAEWEHAARAGSPAEGYGPRDRVAWFADNAGREPVYGLRLFREEQPDYSRRLFANGNGPHPVAQKQPNAWNLHDILGNVWEWTADWYQDEIPGGADPVGPANGTMKIVRGGSWWATALETRVSSRDYHPPDFRFSGYGVRCVTE